MSDKYFNDDPYVLTRGDVNPAFIFTLKKLLPDDTYTPLDLSSYPSSAMRALVREKGAETNLATIACTAVDRSAGQWSIAAWPSTVTEAEDDDDNPITGKLEIQFQLSKNGAYTDTQSVIKWAQFKLQELFGEA